MKNRETRLAQLESICSTDRLFIVGGDLADCRRKLERVKRDGALHGREPVLIATGVPRSSDVEAAQ